MYKNKRAQFFLLAAVIISLVVISLGATTNRVVTQEGNFQEIDDFSYQVQKETGEVLNYEIYSGISGGEVEKFAQLMAEEIQDKDPETEFVFVFGNNEGMTISNYGEDDVEFMPLDKQEAVYCMYLPGSGSLIGDGEVTEGECAFSLSTCHACPPKPSGCLDFLSYYDIPCVNLGSEDIVVVEGVGAVADEYCVYGGVTKKCSEVDDYEPTTTDIPRSQLDGRDFVTVTIDGVDVRIPVSEYRQVQLIIKRQKDDETYINY
jgi:hypothetical protein